MIVAIEPQIVNGTTIIIQQEDSLISIILAVSALCLVIITAVSLWKTNERTRESNKELKKSNELLTLELRQKFEPRFGFENCSIQYENTNTNSATFSCHVTNVGNVSVQNFQTRYFISDKKLSLTKLLEIENKIEKTMERHGGTFPLGTHLKNFKIQFEYERKENLWIIIWMTYEYLDDIYAEMISQINFKSFQFNGYDLFDHKHIEKERKKKNKNNK